VRLEREGGVATVTIDRPERRNALDEATLSELDASLAAVEADPEVRALVLTGAGDRAFAAGADIAAMAAMGPAEARRFALAGQRAAARLEAMPKLTVAAVNGAALGGGCELALACDVRLASERARFGQPEVTLGVTPGWGATLRLPRIVGRANALELILTGRILSAGEAERMGLVSAVLPAGELMPRARELASRAAAQAPVAVRLAKEALRAADAEREADLFALCFATRDQKEGMAAFLEKRAPVWRDA
jgi:enoyl-CoA hydratase